MFGDTFNTELEFCFLSRGTDTSYFIHIWKSSINCTWQPTKLWQFVLHIFIHSMIKHASEKGWLTLVIHYFNFLLRHGCDCDMAFSTSWFNRAILPSMSVKVSLAFWKGNYVVGGFIQVKTNSTDSHNHALWVGELIFFQLIMTWWT